MTAEVEAATMLIRDALEAKGCQVAIVGEDDMGILGVTTPTGVSLSLTVSRTE